MLPVVLALGKSDAVENEPLKVSSDSVCGVTSSPDLLQNFDSSELIMNDTPHWTDNLVLGTEVPRAGVSGPFREFKKQYLVQHPRAASDSRWREAFLAMLRSALTRRSALTEDWLLQNTSRFPPDNSDILQLKSQLNSSLIDMSRDFRICDAPCKHCHHMCLGLSLHEGTHDCDTNHDCDQACGYRNEHEDCDEPTPPCGLRSVGRILGYPLSLTRIAEPYMKVIMCATRRRICAAKCVI